MNSRQIALLFALSSSTAAQAGSVLDIPLPDDMEKVPPIVAEARKVVNLHEDFLLASFVLRVRICEKDTGKWLHRGLTLRKAIALEEKLSAQDMAIDPTGKHVDCVLPK